MSNRGRPPLTDDQKRSNRVRMNLTNARYAGLLKLKRPGESDAAAAERLLFGDDDEEEQADNGQTEAD